MKISPPATLITQGRRYADENPDAWNELLLRYGVAYTCTLISIVAAQLYVPTPFTLMLAAITLLGLPLSLYLRKSGMRLFGRQIPRFLINSTVVLTTAAACFYLLILTQPELFTRGIYHAVMVGSSANDSIAILMSMFLIFAATRSLAIINDKDAVLSAVPSFSVLLLLIVVHRGPAVVAYFLIWAITAAVLFALDHRLESRQSVSGTIPSLEPGQDIKLSARGLMSVMSFSLICAIGISYWLSSRNPEERGAVEDWILGMAGRMTQLALNIPDVSVNSGPERQIDFTSGPALPTRTELWVVRALTGDGRVLQPEYWRLFTLTEYNGQSWSQTSGSGTSIPLQRLDSMLFPPFNQGGFSPRGNNGGQSGFSPRRNNEGQGGSSPRGNNGGQGGFSPRGNNGGQGGNGRNYTFNLRSNNNNQRTGQNQNQNQMPRRRRGYDVAEQHPRGMDILRSFGNDPRRVLQIVEPRAANVGFAPVLPAPRVIRIRSENPPDNIKVRQDGSVNTGVLEPGHQLVVISSVSSGESYGMNLKDGGPPMRKIAAPSPQIALTPAERESHLHLPAPLRAANSRVRLLAQQTLREAGADESDYARARRLSLMLQQRAVYTLRPPAIPANVDATEYFLFQNRRGYCTYFAGALTVLCRSAGIPARVVSGFVNPEWVENGQTGLLREANAHAWTEVWVEGWGWATLDATPPDDRGDNAPDWWENWADLVGSTFDSGRNWLASNKTMVAWGLLMLVGMLTFVTTRIGLADPLLARLQQLTTGKTRLNQAQAQRIVTKSYSKAARHLARRFRRRTTWETPSEWLAAAEAALDLESPQPLRELTRLYQQATYSPREVSSQDGETAMLQLRLVSWKRRKEA